MQIYTTNEVIGAQNVVYKGFVIENLVKSRNAISNWGAGMKSLVGGNIGGLTKLTSSVRNELIDLISKNAANMGANAIIGLRLETSELFEGMIDIVVYGTAVYAE